jgi:hypothetical protein
VLAGATPRPLPLGARVDLPEWFGKEGRAFAERWNRARRTPKFRNSPVARAAALGSLRSAFAPLVQNVARKAADIATERGLTEEEVLAAMRAQEEMAAAGAPKPPTRTRF